MISNTTEYALRAVVLLASEPDTASSAASLSVVAGVPQHYLGKVLRQLTSAGILQSRRGPGGGFTLARPADQITVLEVVSAVDPIRHVLKCPLGREAHGGRLCPLHRRVEQAITGIEDAFRNTLISELLDTDGCLPMCAPKE